MHSKSKNLLLVMAILALTILSFSFGKFVVKADINSDCQNESAAQIVAEGKVDTCTQILGGIAASIGSANATNQKNLSALQSQLNNLNSKIKSLSDQLTKTASDIQGRQEDMGFTQKILEQKTRDYYTFLRLYDPITPFIFADSASNAFQELALRQKAQSADVNSIEQYVNEINSLQNSQASLQKSQAALSVVQKQIAQQTSFLAGEVAKANTYLATLSQKQSDFIAAKLASLGLSRSAYNMKGGCSSDINPFKSPGFSPAFAFFTYGVPNRVGMDQFGAKGRAEQHQLYPQILSAYYNADLTTGNSQSTNIHVVGKNEFGESIDKNWTIEEYLTHLYEMPADFPMEALKAQAIAARSYALSYTNNGAGSICPSQQCQVVKQGAHDSNDAWSQAVRATAGIVLKSGGQPIKAWFSSTHGGYEFTSADIGWSATAWTKRLVDASGGVGSFGDLANNAYDKSSPVFYCDWGSRSSQNGTAWLKPDEVADIANVLLLVQSDPSMGCFVFQPDQPAPAPDPKKGCANTGNWDPGKVKQELSSRHITSYNSVNDVSLSVDFGSGMVTNVTISGDAGSSSFSGDNFKSYFNQRAPANIQIVGPLYNIEKR